MHKANDPSLKSWVSIPENSDFPIQNLPFGIFSSQGTSPSMGIRIGDHVLDVYAVAELGYLDELGIAPEIFAADVLNPFIALGQDAWRKTRTAISDLLEEGSPLEKEAEKVLHAVSEVTMHLPVQIGDYTDFYSSEEHATNVGKMFRPDGAPLLPNWKHIPVGYHGRASSIVVSGTPLHRPKGQLLPQGADVPVFGASKLLDFELEMAFITGTNTALGDTVPVNEAEDHIFGVVLFNDWSARDIQKWEYVPLGPFLGKNFGSSVSPWIVTLDALEPFRVPGPKQDPPVLPYLQQEGDHNFDINLEVLIKPQGQNEVSIAKSNAKFLYWSMAQQLTHQAINGCNIKVGDMYGSGTISGPTPDSYGSMLELTWRGTKPIPMPDGTERKFIQDHDDVIMRGYCEKDGLRIGFGEVTGEILPAK